MLVFAAGPDGSSDCSISCFASATALGAATIVGIEGAVAVTSAPLPCAPSLWRTKGIFRCRRYKENELGESTQKCCGPSHNLQPMKLQSLAQNDLTDSQDRRRQQTKRRHAHARRTNIQVGSRRGGNRRHLSDASPTPDGPVALCFWPKGPADRGRLSVGGPLGSRRGQEPGERAHASSTDRSGPAMHSQGPSRSTRLCDDRRDATLAEAVSKRSVYGPTKQIDSTGSKQHQLELPSLDVCTPTIVRVNVLPAIAWIAPEATTDEGLGLQHK